MYSGFQINVDSGFQSTGFRIPTLKICCILDSGFCYMRRTFFVSLDAQLQENTPLSVYRVTFTISRFRFQRAISSSRLTKPLAFTVSAAVVDIHRSTGACRSKNSHIPRVHAFRRRFYLSVDRSAYKVYKTSVYNIIPDTQTLIKQLLGERYRRNLKTTHIWAVDKTRNMD